MALTVDLQRDTIIAPGTSSIWNDETVYGTGGNPARATLAVYLTAYKVDEDQVETALDVDSFDPETADTFTTENGIDGYHKYYFIIVPRYDVAVEYEQYDVVWSESEEEFFIYINETESTGSLVTNTTYWESIADPTTVLQNIDTDEESGNVSYQIIGKILDYNTSICYLKAAARHAKETCGTGDCGCDSKLGKYYHKIRDLFANLAINQTTEQFIEGEKNARLVEKYCDDCGCLSR